MTTPTPAQVRARAVAWAHWMVFHKAQIHYEEILTVPAHITPPDHERLQRDLHTLLLARWCARPERPRLPLQWVWQYDHTGRARPTDHSRPAPAR